ncbi:MAG TPA: hypothetical protein VGQ94_08465 [Terriglobales bacterium]|nr:hypothetical protein [Terriglobales bacterium]
MLTLVLAAAPAAPAEPLPFRRAIELAVQHSGGMVIAAADQTRAQQSYQEARSLFYPQMALGSGLATTWGFPLSIEGSAPALFRFKVEQIEQERVRAGVDSEVELTRSRLGKARVLTIEQWGT